MTPLLTEAEQNLSYGESRNVDLLGDAEGGSDGIAAGASEVIAIRADDLFDQAEVTQAFQITGDARNGQSGQERF